MSRKRRGWLPGALSLGCLVTGACSAEPLEGSWTFGFDEPGLAGRSQAIEASVLAGGCDSEEVVYEARFRPDEQPPAPPDLGSGTYGFMLRSLDDTCHWYARGCAERQLPGPAEVDVTLDASEPMREEGCVPGAAQPDVVADAGASSDAGADPEPAQDGGTSLPGPDDPLCAPAEGLVACYAFNDDGQDGSGQENHADVSMARFEQAPMGSAVRSDGSAVVVPDSESLDMAGGITVEAWVRLQAVGSASSTVLDNDGQYEMYVTVERSLGVGLHADGVMFRFETDPESVPLDRWTHLAFAFDGGFIALYVDGEFLGQESHTRALSTSNTQPMHLGSSSPSITRPFYGLIDGLRIWDHGRTGAQICAAAGGALDNGGCAR